MNDEHAGAGTTPRDRPLQEQVSVIRHDLGGAQQALAMLQEQQRRMAARIENVEERQTLVEAQVAQLAITPEAVGEVVEHVLDRRTEAARAERRQDLAEAFGKTKTIALYITAIGQAVLMVVGFWYFVVGV